MIKTFDNKIKNYSIFLFHGVIGKKSFKIRNYNKKDSMLIFFVKFLKNLKKSGEAISLNDFKYLKSDNYKKKLFFNYF